MTFLSQNPMMFFFIIGFLLLILELLGTAGYLLWCGVSALLVGFLFFFVPLSLFVAWLLFALFSLMSAYVWWYWLRKKGGDKTYGSKVNQGYQDFIGMETVVISTFIKGQGRVKIYDGSWKAQCDQDLKIGEAVKVIAVHGLILTVIPI